MDERVDPNDVEKTIVMVTGLGFAVNRLSEKLGYFPDERIDNIIVGIGAPFLIKQLFRFKEKLNSVVAFTAYAAMCGYYEYTKGFELSEIQGDAIGVTVAFAFNAAIKR